MFKNAVFTHINLTVSMLKEERNGLEFDDDDLQRNREIAEDLLMLKYIETLLKEGKFQEALALPRMKDILVQVWDMEQQ